MTEQVRTPDVGQVLREYRASQTPRMTQAQLAELLNVDQSHISRIEKGEQKVRSIDFLWRIVKRLGVEPRRLGISPELMDVMEADEHEKAYQAAVAASQQQWLGVRQHLNQHRSELACAAASPYPEAMHLGSRLITQPAWVPAAPVELPAVKLEWIGSRVPWEVRGTEPEAL